MKKSELRQMIQEEYKKTLNEDSVYWSSPLSVSWGMTGPGIWQVILRTQNDKKVIVDGLLSDSMPNTLGKFNKLMAKFIDDTKKLIEK